MRNEHMRIAQLLPYDVDYHGGVREVVFHLSRELERCGHEVTIVAPASGSGVDVGTPQLTTIETDPVVLSVNGSIARVIGLDTSAWRQVADVVRAGSFDVVHLHEPMLWLPVLVRRRLPAAAYVGTFHAAGDESETVDVPGLASQIVTSLVPRVEQDGDEAAGAPGRAPVLRPDGLQGLRRARARSSRNGSSRGLGERSKRLVASLLGRLDAAIAVSPSARAFAASYGLTPGVIIPNGVDVAAFTAAAPAAAPSSTPVDRPTVLFFSRLDERKGLATLVQAMPDVACRVPGVRLVIAGNFALTDEAAVRYRELVARLGVDAEFVPSPSDERKVELFRTSTVLCAPNLGQESFGIILAEALAAGLPIVASDIQAFRDVLDGGRLGVLAPVGDVPALAATLGDTLLDGELRERLSAAGRVKVRDYDWKVVADRTVELYRYTLTGLDAPGGRSHRGHRARAMLTRSSRRTTAG